MKCLYRPPIGSKNAKKIPGKVIRESCGGTMYLVLLDGQERPAHIRKENVLVVGKRKVLA